MNAARLVLVLCLASPVAVADELPPKLADSVLAVTKDHAVVITLNGGREVAGVVAAYDVESVTLIEAGTRRVVAIARIDIASVRLAETHALELSMRAAAPAPQPPSPEGKARHVGLQIGAGPGNVYVDVDYKHFYGFVGTSIGYPVIFSGSPQYFGLALGAGGTWKLSPHGNWSFDLVGTLTPTWYGGFSAGIGVSAGFHYTSPSGFTAGIKLPVFGVAPGCNHFFGDGDGSSYTCLKNAPDATSLVLSYYLQAGMSLPTVTVGYRF